MKLETERLILKTWKENDAEDLYNLAKDPKVGPIAGWPVHKSIENSRDIIKYVLAVPETYAIHLKENNKLIGSIGILTGCNSNFCLKKDECEIGYWVGVPYQNKGYATEASEEIIRHCFDDLKFKTIWSGYYDENNKSKRVQEKCGFKYDHTNQNSYCELMDEVRIEHWNKLTLSDYKNRK